MDTSENNRNTHIKEELVVVVKKKMCMTNKKYLFIYFVLFLLKGLPPLPQLDFGLCARVSPAVFLPLEPTILFHTRQRFPKSRDFPEPAIPFFHLVSGFPLLKTRDFRFRL